MPSKTMTTFTARTEDVLATLERKGEFKHLQTIEGPMGPTVRLQDQDGSVNEAICFCSNNYLGLANDPRVVEAGIEGLRKYGAGTASVRFICGTFDCHHTIENTIAQAVVPLHPGAARYFREQGAEIPDELVAK